MAQNMDKSRRVITLDDERAGLPNSLPLAAGTYTVNPDGSITIGSTVTPAPADQTFLTVTNQLASLANSRRLEAGSNITLDISVAGVMTIAAGSSGPTILRAFKAANTSRSNTAVESNDPDLAFAAVPVGTYKLEMFGATPNLGATEGISGFISTSNTTNTTNSRINGTVQNGGTTTVTGVITAAAPVAVGNGTRLDNGSTNACAFKIEGYLIVETAACDIAFQWAQAASGGTATTLLAGSYMILTRLNP